MMEDDIRGFHNNVDHIKCFNLPNEVVFINMKTAERFQTESTSMTIGRDKACNIWLDEAFVSRVHAKLEFIERSWFIMDTASKNGTALNGVALVPNKRYLLRVGDSISFAQGRQVISVKEASDNTGAQKLDLPVVDQELMTKVINKMYPGIQVFVRDINLSETLAEKYQPGQIIREKAFTDASSRVMGMVTTHRYMILSNHMADLSQFEHGTNWGLCVASRDSHFKVLGKHSYNGNTAIVLLHLPDDDTWKLFVHTEVSLDQQLLEMSIQRFEAKCSAPPIPELTTPQWLERCAFPVGMNDEGVFWPLID